MSGTSRAACSGPHRRDSTDNTYHQIGWSPAGSLAAQVEGLPIWGGQSDDRLAGDGGGIWNDLIHGAGGDDVIVPGGGDDEVWGDAGEDAVSLSGPCDAWNAVGGGTSDDLAISDGTWTKTLRFVEILRFDDGPVPTGEFLQDEDP